MVESKLKISLWKPQVLVLSHMTHSGLPGNKYNSYLYGACGIRHGWFPASVVNLDDYWSAET